MSHPEYPYNGNEIAVIGMAGRFPQSENLEAFWRNLTEGKECISHYSSRELEEAGIDPGILSQPNYVRAKGEIGQLDAFDAAFFGINPKDAELMDPQHRMMLECAWEALEHAGYEPGQCGGSVGVFAGKSMSSYLFLNLYPHIQKMLATGNLQAAIGNDKDSMATTISYRLNLKGPSMAVQSSSSTSLVSVCMAAQSLLTYQCDMALAGGITVGPPERAGYLYEPGGIMSADGHCRAFDENSSGFVPGNGYGLVVLKRLDEAIRDKDHIWSVIKGFAVNNDGADKISYTAPSVGAQSEVIAAAQALAEVDPQTIGYIEAHGTGTRMGDPIEIEALTQAFRHGTNERGYCPIGSVKTNIGHLDSAAGIAGFIKATLMLHHKQIPPTLNYKRPNPAIDFAGSPFYVNTELADWTEQAYPRRAGVNSLGMGGTNAHVILEEGPREYSEPAAPGWQILPVSAKCEASLAGNLARLQQHLREDTQTELPDVAYTLSVGRQAFGNRAAVVCSTREEAVLALETDDPQAVFQGESPSRNRPLVFMFTGQGSQYAGMAAGIYAAEPVFRKYYDQCAVQIKTLTGMDIQPLMLSMEKHQQTLDVNETALTQPLLFAVEYAMAQLLISRGFRPQAMIGHSLGEYAAAAIAGVFSLEDAVLLVCRRAEWMSRTDRGVMLAVGLSREAVAGYLQESITLAAVNSPGLCVLSGEEGAIAGLERLLAEEGIYNKRLSTSHAFHSPLMLPVLAPYRELLMQVELKEPSIPVMSCLTGTWLRAEEAVDPEYWTRHILEPVVFMDGLEALLREGNKLFVELGPGSALCSLGRQNPAAAEDSVWVPVMRPAHRLDEDTRVLAQAIAKLWVCGAELDFSLYYGNEPRRRVPLPTYAFSRQSYWVYPEASPSVANAGLAPGTEASGITTPVSTGPEHRYTGHHARPKVSATYRAPEGRTQQQLVEIMERELHIQPVGADDDFFELGGHSLLATQVLDRIRQVLGVQLSIESIFLHPTVSGMAQLLENTSGEAVKEQSIERLFQEMAAMSSSEIASALAEDKLKPSGGKG
ncbi:acyltransferase domain-containing protein [Paenibacillus albidus]|uniref:type I polyketide synthase n=1 Tax=Paenibacillus albidus TaxID=2041023 RepID=UPI001BE7F248|nr:type I polyketide synthase [Paenibacillus albidus]MBT2291732.1 acyltransferase domain-containing protein [Paenibacillus albidus]